MAGISSNIGTIAVGKQTAKGAPAATPAIKLNLAAAPSLYPQREVARYNMTGAGRDPGAGYTSYLYISGEFQCFMHFEAMGLLSYLALGTNADTGATNFTHVATTALTLPYCTIFRMVGNVVFERYIDCMVGRLAFESPAGGPVLVTIGVEGLTSEFQGADTGLAALTSGGLLHMEAKGAFKHATVAQPLSNFTLEINNNVTRYQADDYIPYDVTPGDLEVNGTFTTLFTGATAFPKYRDFYYGTAAGTQLQVASAAGIEAFQAIWTRNPNASFQIDIPQIRYAAVPVTPDPGGAPIEVAVNFDVDKAGSNSLVTLTSKDQAASVG